jgi:hypothetical protein
MKPEHIKMLKMCVIWSILSFLIIRIIFGDCLRGLFMMIICCVVIYLGTIIHIFIKIKKANRLEKLREDKSKGRVSALEL